MKQIKCVILFLLFNLLGAAWPIKAQTTESPTSIESTENKKSDSIVGWAIGGTAVVVLGIIVMIMVRDRRKTIGGMQNQSKPSPSPVTTQSIDNPRSGV